MSKYKQSLIAILRLNSAEALCTTSNAIGCYGISCLECPFYKEENKQELIKELEGE